MFRCSHLSYVERSFFGFTTISPQSLDLLLLGHWFGHAVPSRISCLREWMRLASMPSLRRSLNGSIKPAMQTLGISNHEDPKEFVRTNTHHAELDTHIVYNSGY